jgi:hypothetical protein
VPSINYLINSPATADKIQILVGDHGGRPELGEQARQGRNRQIPLLRPKRSRPCS